ncbi:MAG: hypothetical protein ACE5HH_01805 [Candidatus Hydrothermarchaeales archaeon]
MEGKKHVETVAAILTTGYIIKTEDEAEDLEEAIGVFERFKKLYEEMLDESASEDLDLVTAVLTAGQILNASSKVGSVEGVMEDFAAVKGILLQMEKRYPGFLKEKEDLNFIASIIVAGLIINTTDWEEGIMDNMLVFRECKNALS